jgi:cell filamentation protein
VTVSDDPYVYPGTSILRNRFGIRDPEALNRIERRLVVQRIREGIPAGSFDLAHLCAIHRHLFQDIYDWAGDLRTVEISRGRQQFQFRQFIVTGMADVHRRLVAAKFLAGLSAREFADLAAVIIGDVNYIRPFREGNGRTQLQYLRALALKAGHHVDLARLEPAAWIEASKSSHDADYRSMADAIWNAIVGPAGISR